MFSLQGKTAIVTGGSRGIGYGIAKALIDAGARVVVTARNEAQPSEAAASLGANCIARRCDNSDPGDIEAMIDAASAFGPIGVLVNNAGISPYYKKAEHVTVEEFDQVSDV